MNAPRAYSPYGQHEHKGSQAMLGFNGERCDPLTHTYALGQGYRSYSQVLMRFQRPDNLSPFLEGGLNAYAYCKNDPVNYQDGSGHSPTVAQLQAAIKKRKRTPTALAEPAVVDVYQKAKSFSSEEATIFERKYSAQPEPPVVRVHQKAKSVSFAESTIVERNYSAHYKHFQERKTLLNQLNRLNTFNELLNSDLDHLWNPATRLNYREINLFPAYRRRLTSMNQSLQAVMIEKERIQHRLQEIRW
nr:RHS repeat-associated core domain-containing protein [Pseudomonas putida]